MSKDFNKDFLFSKCKEKNISIKKLIMDQNIVVGVGNIYASESLFLAHIDPRRLANKISLDQCEHITVAIKKILKRAIKKGGTTLKDFYSADGNEGYFNLKLNVYGRDNEKCKKCKNKIRKINLGQRSTYFCNECQY